MIEIASGFFKARASARWRVDAGQSMQSLLSPLVIALIPCHWPLC
ncbi:hypothetical protein SynA1825c_01219 [Synechococcus sp. A18-25c]|nr:hypothetical protein SynA1825c_01219 [Synechococcus sp. A18-25c]